jgi:hypothetical protein
MSAEPTEGHLSGYLRRVRTTYSGQSAGYRYHRPRWRRPLIVLLVIALVLGVGAYAAYEAYQKYIVKLLTVPGCQAGTGASAVSLDFSQAADAAVIAGTAAREHLPARAVTIAYATGFQESKLENLTYGDRDSVGIFQQRPSQGWGTRAQLLDPAYASRAFFKALVKVPHYATIPVYQAAQAVQASADGYAYQQYAPDGATMAAAYTTAPHAFTCWYTPGTQSALADETTKLDLPGAAKSMADTFGEPGQDGAVTRITTSAASHAMTVRAASGAGWTVANWLVANASSYGITQVSYAGYQWTARLTESGWQSDPSAPAESIVAS